MTTPTPGWGDSSGQNPYDPTHTSPTYDAGLGSPAGPGYTPSYDPGPSGPSYAAPSYDPEPPMGYGAPDPFAPPGYGQSPAYGQPQPYGEPMYAPQQPQAYPTDNQYGYQPTPVPGYGLAPYTMMQAPLPTGMAVASMVCGIAGLVLGWCGFLLPVSIVAIVLGALGVQKANRGEAGGKGMAIAGIVTGGLGAGFSVLILLLGFFSAVTS